MHDEARAGMLEPRCEIARAGLDIEWNYDAACEPDPVTRNRRFTAIGQDDRDTVAALQSLDQ